MVHPNGHIIVDGKEGPESVDKLTGDRVTRAFFADQEVPEIVEDYFYGGKKAVDHDNPMMKRILEEPWYGATLFKKTTYKHKTYTEGGSSGSTEKPNGPGPTIKRLVNKPVDYHKRQRHTIKQIRQRRLDVPMSDSTIPCISGT